MPHYSLIGKRIFICSLLAGIILGWTTFSQAEEVDAKSCGECHDSFSPEAFKASIHGEFDCIDCHLEGPFGEHEDAPKKVDCAECHDGESEEYAKSFHGLARAKGVAEAPSCADCHGDPHLIRPQADPKSETARPNIAKMCARCHADIEIIKKYEIPFKHPLQSYEKSVHGRAMADGNLKAASCSDCHGAHTVQPGKDMDSGTARGHIPETCGKCHQEVLKEYKISVHGVAMEKGIADSPTCTGCHGEHGILKADSPESPVSLLQLSTKTCGHCHEDVTITEKYGPSAARLSTYLSSYHGLAVNRGAVTVANCASCHNTHKILPSSDPNSSIYPANLANTCGTCHPGASDSFATIPVHLESSPTKAPILHFVRLGYIWLIFLVIGGMLLHNFLIYLAAIVTKYQKEKKERTFERFPTIALVAHGLLLTSFTLLVLTGFGLRFPHAAWASIFDWLYITEEGRRIIHRVAACVMLGAGTVHMLHLVVSREARKDWMKMWPSLLDVKEAFQNIFYYLGIVRRASPPPKRPKLGRYSYIQKAEYWAVLWGTFVMAFSGFCLWFPVLVSPYLPEWGIPLMDVIHYYEAWLATLAIVVWHFFFVILHPDEYPMSLAWLTGRISRHEMEREHGGELKEIEEKESE